MKLLFITNLATLFLKVQSKYSTRCSWSKFKYVDCT
uniref:Uncharacterized protein n=1 Tax=Arundo donax TaxID=35708 RepID=A0A0A9CBY7_ARUDO